MRLRSKKENQNRRNNANSIGSDDYNIINPSRDNNSNTTWRKWNNQ